MKLRKLTWMSVWNGKHNECHQRFSCTDKPQRGIRSARVYKIDQFQFVCHEDYVALYEPKHVILEKKLVENICLIYGKATAVI